MLPSRIAHPATNLGVRSSNLFGRARSPTNIRIILTPEKTMQNKIIWMARESNLVREFE
jgi:hypothetical protein